MSDTINAERDSAGRFTVGNPGGPGRPRRAVELSYLRALSDELTLEDWRQIVRGAIERAKAGDPQARQWVARYALGPAGPSLSDLALREVLGVDEGHELRALARRESTPALLRGFGDNESPLALAVGQREADEQRAEAERKAAERRLKREQRALGAADPGEAEQ